MADAGPPLVLMALGLILWLAVNATLAGLSIQTIGIILFVVGVVWLLIELVQLLNGRPSPARCRRSRRAGRARVRGVLKLRGRAARTRSGGPPTGPLGPQPSVASRRSSAIALRRMRDTCICESPEPRSDLRLREIVLEAQAQDLLLAERQPGEQGRQRGCRVGALEAGLLARSGERWAVVIVEVGGRVKTVGRVGARGLEGFEHELDGAVQCLGDLGGRRRSSEVRRELR